MFRRRYPPQPSASSVRSTLHDSSSSEDEEDQLRREEQEQERLFSEQHGEANEASASNKRQSDTDIANALNSTDAAKKKKPRITLTDSKLTGPAGLIRIRHEFSRIKYRPAKPVKSKDKKIAKRKQFERDIHASAVYIGKLMQAYQEFALDIAPNMHYNDTFRKIQDLGSKKVVKDYLNTMREEICKEHMENIYGREKAEKYALELENGLQSMKDDGDEYDNYDYVGGTGVSRRLATIEAMENGVENQDSFLASAADKNLNESKGNLRPTDSRGDDDEDAEMEASFEDIVPSETQFNEDAAKKTPGAQRNVDNEHSVSDQNLLNEPRADSEEEGDNEEDNPKEDKYDVTSGLEERDEADQPNTDPGNTRSTIENPMRSEEKESFDVLEARADSDEEDNGDEDVTKEDQFDEDNDLIKEKNEFDHPIAAHANADDEQNKSVSSDNAIVEISQTQESSFGISQSQGSFHMTQETMVLDLSQTQGATQETLVVDLSQTQGSTQETLVDLSQAQPSAEDATQNTNLFNSSQASSSEMVSSKVHGSQDY